jgi:hypothetical protein
MEPVCLLECSQEPAICSYLKPDEITLCCPILTVLCHTHTLSSSVNAEINALCTIHDTCIILVCTIIMQSYIIVVHYCKNDPLSSI